MSELPITNRRTKAHRLFDGLANFHGPLAPDIKRRLRAVIENPSDATWQNAFSIVLRPEPGFGLTLWQAVMLVDPEFPTKGPGQDAQGRRGRWAKVPDQLTLVRAIRAAKSGRLTVAQFRARVGLPPDGH